MPNYLKRFWCCLLLTCSQGYMQAAAPPAETGNATAAVVVSTQPRRVSFLDIPEVLVQLICSYVDAETLIRGLYLVNKDFHYHAQSPVVWQYWQVELAPEESKQWELVLRPCKNFYVIESRFRRCSTVGKIALARQNAPFAHLRVVKLRNITDLTELDFLVTLTQLRGLEVQLGRKVMVGSWAPLGQCTQLTHLALQLYEGWEKVEPVLNTLHNLEFIALDYLASGLKGVQLTWAKFTCLQELELSHYPDKGMRGLLPLQGQLKALTCEHWQKLITVKHLADFKVLEKLVLWDCERLTNLYAIQHLGLRVLVLSDLGAEEKWVKQLKHPEAFPQLQELYFGTLLGSCQHTVTYAKEEPMRAALAAARPKVWVQGYDAYSGVGGVCEAKYRFGRFAI